MNQAHPVAGGGESALRPASLPLPRTAAVVPAILGPRPGPRPVTAVGAGLRAPLHFHGRTVQVAKATGLRVLPMRQAVPTLLTPSVRTRAAKSLSSLGDTQPGVSKPESKRSETPAVAGGTPAKPVAPSAGPRMALIDARTQAFLLERGIDRLDADNCRDLFLDIFKRTATRVVPSRGDAKAASWSPRTADVARCLAAHMVTLRPPIPGWEDAFVSALVAREINRPTHSEHRSFLAGLRALAAALEPQRSQPSPALFARVLPRVLQPALPAAQAINYANRGVAHRLVAAVLKDLAAPHPAAFEPQPEGRAFCAAHLSQGAAHSPVELGQIVRDLVRNSLPTPRGELLLMTLRDTLMRHASRFDETQMAAMGCGYAIGLAGPDADAKHWKRVNDHVVQHCGLRGDVMSFWMAQGMYVGAAPAQALERPGLTAFTRSALLYLALDLERPLDARERLALVLKLKHAPSGASSLFQVRQVAECMTRVLESGTGPQDLPSLIEACTFVRRALTDHVNDYALKRRIGRPAEAKSQLATNGDAKKTLGAGAAHLALAEFDNWTPFSFGAEVLVLHRLLGRLYDLACDRLALPSAAVRGPFAKNQGEALSVLPLRLRQSLLQRLRPLQVDPTPPQETALSATTMACRQESATPKT